MPAHDWSGKGFSSCNACDIYRMKRSGSWAYAERTRGPWSREEPACVPIDRPPPMFDFMSGERVLGWRACPLLVLDVETNHLDWACGEVIEIGGSFGRIVRTESGFRVVPDTVVQFQSLIKPSQPIAADCPALAINGIKPEDLDVAPTQAEVARKLVEFIGSLPEDTICSMYNESFDHPFITGALLMKQGVEIPRMLYRHTPRIDPYMWSRKIDRYVKGGHKLMAIAERYGLLERVGEGAAHRADYDARVTLEVIAEFASRVPDHIEDLMDFQNLSRSEWGQFLYGRVLPEKRRAERELLEQADCASPQETESA